MDDSVAVAANSLGDLVAVGRFHSEINLGGDSLTAVDGPAAMDGYAGDVFVAKFSSVGVQLWSRSGGGIGADTPADVAVDDNDDVIVVGVFALTANLGGADLVSPGGGDIFTETSLSVAPLTALWKRQPLARMVELMRLS